jgi:hypothetical protein
MVRVQGLDPSKGADAKSGDYQAHVLCGLGRHGTIYLEAVLAREPVPLMVARALELAARFSPLDRLVIEDNDVLGMLVSEFTTRVREGGRVLPIEGVRQSLNKVVRVRRLASYFGRGQIRFRKTPGTGCWSSS